MVLVKDKVTRCVSAEDVSVSGIYIDMLAE